MPTPFEPSTTPDSPAQKESFWMGSLRALSVALRQGRWLPTSDAEHHKAEVEILEAVQSPHRQEMVEVKPGEYLNTLVVGDESKKEEVVVMLHGYGGGIGTFVGTYDAVTPHAKVYSLDMVGFSRSSMVPYKSCTAPEKAEEILVDYLEKWVEKMGIEKFTIVGHSFGGYVAANYSKRHPERVTRLVLADPWGVPAMPPDQKKPHWLIRTLATISGSNPLAFLRGAGPVGPLLFERARPDLINRFAEAAGGRKDASMCSACLFYCFSLFDLL
mmetsp:Transcript_43738/g.114039  ORF Transcript_43738/g.114039 Transcript_43738/m.114039 type:complete len:272 (-) Transcript_43738:1174-1989(-)